MSREQQQSEWHANQNNLVHPIIRESPFFDHTSKNGLLWDQAANDMRLWDLCNNRVAFEDRLRGISGVEYMIAKEPERTADGDTGIWVIHKQDRRKTPGAADKVTLLATYYIMGENMYQAPSVYDVVGNRLVGRICLLSLVTLLTSPALGHELDEQIRRPRKAPAALHARPRLHVLPSRTEQNCRRRLPSLSYTI